MAGIVKNFSDKNISLENLSSLLIATCKMCSQLNIDEENLKVAVEDFLKKFEAPEIKNGRKASCRNTGIIFASSVVVLFIIYSLIHGS